MVLLSRYNAQDAVHAKIINTLVTEDREDEEAGKLDRSHPGVHACDDACVQSRGIVPSSNVLVQGTTKTTRRNSYATSK
jgi:hypothetical protein